MMFAIDWVLGGRNHVMVLDHVDRDGAYEAARANLCAAGFKSAALQGQAGVASQRDIDSAGLDARECSICRRVHGLEVVHAYE